MNLNDVDVDRLRERGDQPLPLFDPGCACGRPRRPGRGGHAVKPPSMRQLQMLRLAALGYSNPRIGRELWVTVNTVETHLFRAFKRIGAKGRANAVAICLDAGWLERVPAGSGFDVVVPEPAFEHGTRAGFKTHHRRGSSPCRPCLDANAEYVRAWVARQARVAS